MKRREFIKILGGAAAASPLAARTQKVWRIGMLETTSEAMFPANITAFRQGLRDLGYVEGQNLIIEYRSADGHSERFPPLAAELISLNVDLIVTRGTPATLAVKKATKSIPVVVTAIGDPLLVVASLAYPGGNITGFSSFVTDLMAKRVELAKAIVPGLARVAGLLNMSNGSELGEWNVLQTAARILGVQSQLLDVQKLSDIEPAFDDASKQHADVLIVGIDALTQANQQLIVDLAMKYRLPAIYPSREFVGAGGLLNYGVNYPDLYRRSATLVDKIFRGAKPADLPVEQPTKFELNINLRAAKTLGVEVPPLLLARADEVIE
jgi:putative ABC transport system substrate-binding protein